MKNFALIIGVSLIPFAFALLDERSALRSSSSSGIDLDRALKPSSHVLWIDSRPKELFDQKHIPDAINLNQDNWNAELPRLFAAYSPGQTVIVYCSAGCFESREIASKIRDLGLDRVLVLKGGFEAWLSRQNQP